MDITIDLDKVWNDAWNAEIEDIIKYQDPNFDTKTLRQSSRTTKANPDGENAEWWYVNGRKFLDSWIAWRKGSGWNIFPLIFFLESCAIFVNNITLTLDGGFNFTQYSSFALYGIKGV